LLIVLVWHRPPLNIQPAQKAAKSSGTKRKWKPKSPHDCPACQEGITLNIRPIHRKAKPMAQVQKLARAQENHRNTGLRLSQSGLQLSRTD
jgi:hypothetical protein